MKVELGTAYVHLKGNARQRRVQRRAVQRDLLPTQELDEVSTGVLAIPFNSEPRSGGWPTTPNDQVQTGHFGERV